MKQCLAATVLELSDDGSEVCVILPSALAHVEHGEAALLEAGRHEPVRISGHKQAHVISYRHRLLALELDEAVVAGHEVLELALGGLVSGPERLVAVQKKAGSQMRVEAADH